MKLLFISSFVVLLENLTGYNLETLAVILLICVIEVSLRLIPTKKRSSFVSRILIFSQNILDILIPDKIKNV
jgi:hypothetical protein